MAVPREMTITYGTQSVPGTVAGARLELNGVHKVTKTRDEFEVAFEVVVDGLGSPSVLAAACKALEVTFSTRRLALDVDLDGSESFTASDAAATGFEVTPEIRKLGDDSPQWDSNRSRLYEVTIRGGLESLGTGGLRDFSYTVDYDPSRRPSLDATGSYTARSAPLSGAVAIYQGAISARVLLVTAALGGTWELVTESYEPDDQDQVVNFSRTYKEILANQIVGALDSPAIVDPNLLITRSKRTSEGGLALPADPKVAGTKADKAAREVVPLFTVTAEYSSAVDSTVSKNLEDVWTSIIRPVIFAQMKAVAGGGLAITSIDPRFNQYTNTIQATVVGEGIGSSNVLEREIETLDEVDFGKVIRYVWPSEIPDDEGEDVPAPTPAYVYQSHRKVTRTITTRTVTVTGTVTSEGVRNARTVDASASGSSGAITIGDATYTSELTFRRTTSRRRRKGIRELGGRIDTIERETQETYEILVTLGTVSPAVIGAKPNVGGNAGDGGSAGR